MFYPILSTLKDYISNDKIELFDKWIYELSPNAKKIINSFKLSRAIEINLILSEKILSTLVNKSFLKQEFVIICPSCEAMIKKTEISDLMRAIEEISNCYFCGEDIDLSSEDIDVIYSVNEGPDNAPFVKDQCFNNARLDEKYKRALVDNYNSFEEFIKSGSGLNSIMYAPKDEDYSTLETMFEAIFEPQANTTKAGNTLADLIIKILNLCHCFKVGKSIKTTVNEVDVVARNIFGNIEIPAIKYMGNLFFVECKNEATKPKGDYMQKINDIIDLSNNNNDFVKFGMIVSKNSKPSTFIKLSNKYYLKSNRIIVSLDSSDLRKLILNKHNFLDMIEQKCTEVIMDATSDLKVSGLF